MSVVGHNVIFPTVIGVCRRKDLVIPVKEAVAKCDDYQGMKSTTITFINFSPPRSGHFYILIYM